MADSHPLPTEETSSSNDLQVDETYYPGPIYDAALRGVMEADPAATCRFLGIPFTGVPELLPTEFPAWKKAVDLLMRVDPEWLAHVEYARRGDRKLVVRMLEYRCLIMRDYPESEVVQHTWEEVRSADGRARRGAGRRTR